MGVFLTWFEGVSDSLLKGLHELPTPETSTAGYRFQSLSWQERLVRRVILGPPIRLDGRSRDYHMGGCQG